MPSEMKVNKISPASGTAITLGDSGDTFTITSGVTLAGAGTSLTALNATQLTSGTIPIARIADDAVTLAKMADDAIGVAQLSATGTASSSTFLRGDNAWVAPGGGLYASVAILADQKASDIQGGSITNGAWRTRDLNTEVSDVDGIVSISSNQFTLQAGTYTIDWACTALETNNTSTRLYNVTDNDGSFKGFSFYTSSSDVVSLAQGGSCVVTIAGAKAFEVQMRSGNTRATYGMGHRIDFTTNTYCIVKILKHA